MRAFVSFNIKYTLPARNFIQRDFLFLQQSFQLLALPFFLLTALFVLSL